MSKVLIFTICSSLFLIISAEIGLKQSQPSVIAVTPPNLRIRSRMMAALNSGDLESASGQPIILIKKNKKSEQKKEPKVFFKDPEATTPRAPQKVVPSSANFAVNPVLQTNFVDSAGRVLQNVVAVPIRVGDGTRRTNATRTAATAVLETEEDDKKVEVRFGQAPIHL